MSGEVKDIDHGWNQLVAELLKLTDKSTVAVGIQGAEASAPHEGGLTNAQLGTIHEFGAPGAGIPERSFLRSTVENNRTAYADLIAKGLDRVVRGALSVEQLLGLIGARVVADVKKTIRGHIAPPLKTATIRRKGSSTPLIGRTGQLINSITWQVKRADEGENV